MELSAPWGDSLDIIAFQPVKKLLWINPTGLSAPREDSLDMISLRTLKNLWINPMVLSAHRANSLGIIDLQTFTQIFEGLTQWDLVPLGMTLLILFPFGQQIFL